MHQLAINRTLQNDSFSSWRLGKEFLVSRKEVHLPEVLAIADTGNINDYLHTRASVMHNHVHQTQGSVYLFTTHHQSDVQGRAFCLWTTLPCPTAEPPLLLQRVAVLPNPELPHGSSLAPGACPSDCSIAVMQQNHTSQEAQTATGVASSKYLLVSSGMGDLRLLCVDMTSHARAMSNTVFPVREALPLTGVLPVKIEAAYVMPAGSLRCILWAVRSKQEHMEAACQVYSVLLQYSATGSDLQLVVQDVQLLASTSLPPHCVSYDPITDSVVIGLEPNKLETFHHHHRSMDSVPSTSQPQQPSANQAAVVSNSNSKAAADNKMDTDDVVEHIECRPPQWMKANDDDDECDIDPRTLAEAAARLAKYTSEEPVGDLPHQQWADLYKETGPDEIDSQTACDLVAWTFGSRGPEPTTSSSSSSSSVHEPWRLSCGAHRVLTSDSPGLLGVNDDVDCCVLRVAWSDAAATTGPSPAGGAAAGALAAAGASAVQPHVPTVQHVSTIPALSYVAAGKTQRKHLLLGGPSAPCAAILVEGTRFYYVYDNVVNKSSHGYQQVVDMQLASDERVMGAAILSCQPYVSTGSQQILLLILTAKRLLVHTLGPAH